MSNPPKETGPSLAKVMAELTADLRQAHDALNKEIQERRLCEDQLRRSLRQRRQLMEACPLGVAVIDTKGSVVECNHRIEEILGLSRDDILGLDFRGDDVTAEVASAVLRACTDGADKATESFLVQTGSGRPTRAVCRSVVGDDHAILGAVLFLFDPEPATEDAPLSHQESLRADGLQALLSTSALIEVDGSGALLAVHSLRQIGLSEATEIESLALATLLPGDASERFLRYVRLTLRSGQTQEVGIPVLRGGETMQLLTRFAAVGEGRVAVRLDNVTDLKTAELSRRVMAGQLESLRARAAQLEEELATARMAPPSPVSQPEAAEDTPPLAQPGSEDETQHLDQDADEAPGPTLGPPPEAETVNGQREPGRQSRRGVGARWSDAAQRLAHVIENGPEADHDMLKDAFAGGRTETDDEASRLDLDARLESSDALERLDAARGLVDLGHNKRALPVLMHCLRSNDPWVRGTAAFTLGRMGTDASSATDELIARLRDPDTWVRAYAATALGQFGELAAAAAPKLITLFTDPDPLVNSAAAAALQRTGAPPLRCVAELNELRNSPSATIRAAAQEVLGRVGASDVTEGETP